MTTTLIKEWEDNYGTCKCDDPKCGKCILVKCKDNKCAVHSREEKFNARQEQINNLEKSVEANQKRIVELRRELDYLNEKPERFHMFEDRPEPSNNREIIIEKLSKLGWFGLFISIALLAVVGFVSVISHISKML